MRYSVLTFTFIKNVQMDDLPTFGLKLQGYCK
jgi:hypothetical protein